MDTARLLQLYSEANGYLNQGLIRPDPPPSEGGPTRQQWMEWMLPRISHPEQAYSAIHVAGTSGKGSVSTMVAEILRAAGWQTGLHVSPYLQVSTEKLWVNGAYASASELAELVSWFRPIAEACRAPEVPLHGLAAVAVALEHFRRRGVEIAVIEVGVGGRQDVTNVLRTRVAVVGSVGLDHLKALGPTLADIAWHKAGVIRPGCRAVVLEGAGLEAARRQAAEVGAPLRVIDRTVYRASRDAEGLPALDYRGRRFHLSAAPLGMAGPFQAMNAALAVAAVEELDAEERISEEAVWSGLRSARLPGRMELIPPSEPNRCPVLLDGAHNPDKLSAMLAALPDHPRRRLHVLYGALASRAPDEELRTLASRAFRLVITEPQVYGKPPRPAGEIARAVAEAAAGTVAVEPDPFAALDLALGEAGPEDLLLITGSVYLCGALRGRWYPVTEVLRHQRSWF